MKKPELKSVAFSLVEVTMALGIVSFALVAIMGLLPVGLKLVKNADEQGGAGAVVTSIAEAIRSSRTANNVDFTWTFDGEDVAYRVGDAGTVTTVIDNLNLQGVGDSSLGRRFTACVEITPPVSLGSAGRGTISVAWSARANPGWNSVSKSWSNVDGFVTTGIQFLPQP